MATITKNSKTNKIAIFSRTAGFMAEILYGVLILTDIKIQKICSTIRSQ